MLGVSNRSRAGGVDVGNVLLGVSEVLIREIDLLLQLRLELRILRRYLLLKSLKRLLAAANIVLRRADVLDRWSCWC